MNSLIDVVKSFTTLSPKAEVALEAKLKYESAKKGELLLREGRTCERIWFLNEGFARVFYYDDEKEITDWIGGKDSFILSIPSFFLQQPSHKSIELLAPAQLTSIHYLDLESLCSQFHEVERFARLISNHALTLMAQKIEDVHFKTALERYQIFIERHPEIMLHIPLGVVASYLGMTQETLSRVRAK